MNLQLFLAAINALEELMPPVLSLVNAVHPGDGQQANKVNTAIATTSAVLQSVGVAASTFDQLKPAISAIVSAQAPQVAASTVPAVDAVPVANAVTVMSSAQPAQTSDTSSTSA